MEQEPVKKNLVATTNDNKSSYATPYWYQYFVVTKRCFQNYWRNPNYIWSKFYLVVLTSLFDGFSFYNEGTSLQGMQNQMLSVFMYCILLLAYGKQNLQIFSNLRSLYEVRERPSKIFSWVVFLASQIIAWNT
ncbi:unnamed protein product [Ambrosiozyma monospora]|uniref:Unnamed protein product n=1 Tax=Ambrosiozyma monospora TaxID=43982 RepID=A0ACB5TZB6_AMBMO|nr:unnamed protein product [Ambrosiozyma monospora]